MLRIKYKKINDLQVIVNDAIKECEKDESINLILPYEFNIDILESKFVKSYENKAKEWISDNPGEDMYFTHGKYYFGKVGQEYIANELKIKPTTRRAILNAFNMEELFNSSDTPIPAFIVLQFRIIGKILYLTAFFRALEVSEFLPINLTEICLHSKEIRRKNIEINRIRLCIVATSAHIIDEFTCLRKAEIDYMEEAEIGVLVADKEKSELIRLLYDKGRHTSYLDLKGISALIIALNRKKDAYPAEVLIYAKNFKESIEKEKNERKITNSKKRLLPLRKKSREDLDKLIQVIGLIK